jgi:hypothetical protein
MAGAKGQLRAFIWHEVLWECDAYSRRFRSDALEVQKRCEGAPHSKASRNTIVGTRKFRYICCNVPDQASQKD